MNRKSLFFALALPIMLLAHVAEEQSKKAPRIGWFVFGHGQTIYAPFMDGLHELGWFEGKNIVIERRFA